MNHDEQSQHEDRALGRPEDDMTETAGNDASDAGDTGPDPEGTDAPSLEKRLKRLEEIVRSLEAADIDMDEALTLFEEGVEHVRGAEATLRVAELKVEELLGSEEDPMIRPLEEDRE
jgi:exodeoxyribonuclease VII small subunit